MTATTTKTTTLADRIRHLHPCSEAVRWLASYTDPARAWAECQRGDWMLWIIGRVAAERRRLVLAAAACARLALPHATDSRVAECLDTAERWATGRATIDELRKACNAAAAVVQSATGVSAAAAARSAIDVAFAAFDEDYDSAPAAAAEAAEAAAAAEAAEAAAAAEAAFAQAIESRSRSRALAKFADIVRQYFPNPPQCGG